MNKFYIESPFQLLCALPHVKDDDVVIIRPTSSSTEKQLESVINVLPKKLTDNIKIFHFRPYLKPLNIFISFFLFLKGSEGKKYYGYHGSKVFRWVHKLFPNEHSYILDDGVATLSLNQADFFSSFPNVKLLTIFHRELVDKNAIYNDKVKKYISDLFCVEQLADQEETKATNYFVGTKLVKAGFLEKERYFDILRLLFASSDIKYYLLHRDEVVSDSYIAELEEIGLTVVSLKHPLEVAVLLGEIKVETLFGILSTSLISVKELCNISTKFIPISHMVSEEKKEICENIEFSFLSYGVEKYSK